MTTAVATPIDAAPPARRETFEAVRGGRRAVDGCGFWPTAATEAEYRAAIVRAGDELSRAAEVWRRYCRRFNQLYAPIEHAPVRLLTRHLVAGGEFDRRIERLHALLGEPAGSA